MSYELTTRITGYGQLRRSRRLENRVVIGQKVNLPLPGPGYLAGQFPGGITTVDAVPVSATVRVLYRPEAGAQGDGLLIAEVQSAHDGTWRVDGLNPALRYDVVGRKAGFNDVIMANVTPEVV